MTLRLKSWRFRDDDGGETDATWRQALDVDDTQDTDTTYRVRFAVEETAGAAANNQQFRLKYRVDGGSWTNVSTSSSNVVAVSSNLVNRNDTTQQISSPDTFQGGNGQCDDGRCDGPRLDFAGNDTWEGEYSYQLVGTDLSGGETVDLRLNNIDVYGVADATITVSTPAGPSRRIFTTS